MTNGRSVPRCPPCRGKEISPCLFTYYLCQLDVEQNFAQANTPAKRTFSKGSVRTIGGFRGSGILRGP